MKKTLSIIMSAILIISVFTFSAFAADTKTETLLEEINKTKEVAITLTAGDIPLFGANSDSKDIVYIKDDKVAYEYKAGFINIRVVMDGGDIIAFIPAIPYIHVKLDTLSIDKVDVWELINKITNVTVGVLNYVDSYEENLDGKIYYVEEFNDRAQVTSKFYYEGEELKALIVTDAKTHSVQKTYFEGISLDVDDEIFSLPLISFDMTPILAALFLSLMAA